METTQRNAVTRRPVRALVIAVVVVIVTLVPSTGQAASRSKVTVAYDGYTSWHAGVGDAERWRGGLGLDGSIWVPVPTWARLAKVWVTDDSGLPVRAVAYSSSDDFHSGMFCSPGPQRVDLDGGADLYVGVDAGVWMPAACPVSRPTSGRITVAFYDTSGRQR